jgi:hypothetical protein
MKHNSNEANYKVHGNQNTRHANSSILITTPFPPLLNEILFTRHTCPPRQSEA